MCTYVAHLRPGHPHLHVLAVCLNVWRLGPEVEHEPASIVRRGFRGIGYVTRTNSVGLAGEDGGEQRQEGEGGEEGVCVTEGRVEKEGGGDGRGARGVAGGGGRAARRGLRVKGGRGGRAVTTA
eukprot:143071-Chlamydomonas_euryale.AAC.5